MGKPERIRLVVPVDPLGPVDLLVRGDPEGLVGQADDKSNSHPVQIFSSRTTHYSPPAKNLIQFTQGNRCVERDEGTGGRLRMRQWNFSLAHGRR